MSSEKFKVFNVGDSIIEKRSGRQGIILNKYMGHYLLEFTVSEDNAFKKETLDVPENSMQLLFTKGKTVQAAEEEPFKVPEKLEETEEEEQPKEDLTSEEEAAQETENITGAKEAIEAFLKANQEKSEKSLDKLRDLLNEPSRKEEVDSILGKMSLEKEDKSPQVKEWLAGGPPPATLKEILDFYFPEISKKNFKSTEDIQDMIKTEISNIRSTGTKLFGDAFSDFIDTGSIASLYNQFLKEKSEGKNISPEEREIRLAQRLNELRQFSMQVYDDIKNNFAFVDGVVKIIDKMSVFRTGITDPKTAEEFKVAFPNINRLMSFLVNLSAALEDMPLFRPGEFPVQDTGIGPISPRKTEKETQERVYAPGREEKKEEIKKDLPNLMKSVEDWMTQQNISVSTKLNNTNLTISGAQMRQAHYDISIGDVVEDPKYGKGSVTDIKNLENGAVEVTFSDNVKVASYSADAIAAPFYTEVSCVTCPVDGAVLTIQACHGDEMSAPCSFLKFVENKPVCMYHKEMEMIHANQAAGLEKKAALDTSMKQTLEYAKAWLQEATKTAGFEDHESLAVIEKQAPLMLFANVKHKKFEKYGQIIEREDETFKVQWTTGEISSMWPIEINAVEELPAEETAKLAKIEADNKIKHKIKTENSGETVIVQVATPPETEEDLKKKALMRVFDFDPVLKNFIFPVFDRLDQNPQAVAIDYQTAINQALQDPEAQNLIKSIDVSNTFIKEDGSLDIPRVSTELWSRLIEDNREYEPFAPKKFTEPIAIEETGIKSTQ